MIDFAEVIFRFINRFKIFIIIFWTTVAVISCFYGFDLPNQTVFQFLPPSGSESDIAYNQMEKYFPQFLFIDTEVILVQAKWNVNDTHNILNPNTAKISKMINDSIWNKVNPDYNLLMDIQSFYSTANVTDHVIPFHGVNYSVQSYIDMAKKPKYIDSQQDVMLIYIRSNINGASTQKLNGFIDAIKRELNEINSYYNDYCIVLTGGITIFQECMEAISEDMTTKDVVVMPLIFCFMIYMIGSWKLVALPAIALGMTITISFGIFYPFAVYILQVNPMTPSIMMFLSMALSIDYSMFLLSRFAEERRKGKSVENAVKEMIKYSGHVVCLSGIVLIICYLAIVIFPIAGMETVGYGAAVSISICIMVTISMTSSVILQFPNCFGTLEAFPSGLIRCCLKMFPCNKCKKYQHYGLPPQIQIDEKLLAINESQLSGKENDIFNIVKVDHIPNNEMKVLPLSIEAGDIKEESFDAEQEDKVRKNCYFKLTQYTTRWPYNCMVPLVIYGLMLPAIYQLTHYSPSIDFTMNFPQNADSVNAYNILINDFNPGDMAPMYILVVSKEDSIWNKNYFNALCAVGNKLLEVGYENNTQMISIGFAPNIKSGGIKCVETTTSIELYKELINNPSLIIGNYTNSRYWQYYMKWFNQTVNNPNQTVSIIMAIPNFNPYTGSALENCENYRNAINEVKNEKDIKQYVDIYLHESLFWEIDGLHETNKTLPYALSIIIIIIFLLIGLVFKAIFLPFRLFLCIIVPIIFVYGCIVGVFQNGWLEWTSWHSLHTTDGIGWMLPVITCTVLIGLALDYEIFLFSRIYELRKKGYIISASIIIGVSTTGPIISAAGFVMASAFIGLLLENIITSNQMGLVFVFGVLIDTFIVRPLIVPSLLSFGDKLNWYPTKMQTPKLNEYGKSIIIN